MKKGYFESLRLNKANGIIGKYWKFTLRVWDEGKCNDYSLWSRWI